MALAGKRVLFPGLDLHTRCRYRRLRRFLRAGDLDTLDVGFGNGALMYAAYRRGNRVLGITVNPREIASTESFFRHLDLPSDRVGLKQLNVYDLRSLGQTFDQIICTETLEHIARDADVVRMFADLLRPGGRLLLCAPFALHPAHALGRAAGPEDGGHVRDGYTLEAYRRLLEPTDLRILEVFGLGSPLLCRLDDVVRSVRHRLGDLWAAPLFLLALPLTSLDYPNPQVPFSLGVLAERPSCQTS